MILHRIAAANVGPFVDVPAVAGPFAPGLNILAARNESGKTTLLKAAGRALFDRHTCSAAEIKNLRPAGTTLAPSITVEFETGVGCYRIEKTFLQGPRSVLSERREGSWKLVADGDSADDRLNALLQSVKPGRGATDIAHWGMLGYLWMRQGEPAEWPEWRKSPMGQTVQGMLVKVEIDPFVAAASRLMWSVFTENFTPATNQPKAGGILLSAEEELGRINAELAVLEQTRRDLQQNQETYDRLASESPRLEEEYQRRRQDADALRAATNQFDVLKVEVDRRRQTLAITRERINAVQHDDQTLRTSAGQAGELAAKARAAQDELVRCESAALSAHAHLRQAETAQEENAQALAVTLAEQARLTKRLRHRGLAQEITRGELLLERCRGHAAHVELLSAERAELPTISPAKLTRLEKLQETILADHARVEALGLTVELAPSSPAATVTVHADDSPPEMVPLSGDELRKVLAAQTLTLHLPGWGTVRVRSGVGEARVLRESLARDKTSLHLEFSELGVIDLPAARSLLGRARDLDSRLEAARGALANASGDPKETTDSLRARLAAQRRQLELLTHELALTPAEETAPDFDLEGAEHAVTVRLENGRSEGKTLDRRLKEAREAVTNSAQERERAGRTVLTLRLAGENLDRQAAAVCARYPDGLEAALIATGENFALATFALKQAEEKLPPDADSLPERNRRASTAAEQVQIALDRNRSALSELRGRLELQGASGLHTRESTLRIRHEMLGAQVTQARSRSRAARLVHDLIERRKQAATRAVLAPLQERLGTRFAEISGARDRRVFLDESLVVRGLGPRDGETVPFAELSQGAKEQLLLCLRVAIAEELMSGGEGPQSLILDDVLVNTDAARQERVLTMLGDAAAKGLQILICTCHPDRYRGVGQVVELRRTRDPV